MIVSLRRRGCQFFLRRGCFLFLAADGKMKESLMSSFLAHLEKGIRDEWGRPYQGKNVGFYGGQPHCLQVAVN